MSESTTNLRLSPQQKRLWARVSEDPASCLTQGLVGVTGSIDTDVLKAALGRLVARHAALRTCFRAAPGLRLPVQMVTSTPEVTWRITAPGDVAKVAETERLRERDLAEQPPLAACLVPGSKNGEATLILTLPGLCADSTSLRNMVSDLATAYGEELASNDAPNEAIAYGRFSEWQNQLLEEPEAEEGRRYWKEKHGVKAAEFQLPFVAVPRGGPGRFSPAVAEHRLDEAATVQLENFAEDQQEDIEGLLLAAWQAYLSRWTQQPDLAVGWIYDGREHESLEEGVGLYARCLPIGLRLASAVRLEEVLQRVSAEAEDVGEWQEYYASEDLFVAGFEWLEESQIHRVAETNFALLDHTAPLERFTVKLEAVRRPRGLALRLRYDAALLTAESAACMVGQLARFVAALAAEPRRALDTIDLLGDDERQRWVENFNDTKTPLADCRPVHLLLEDHVDADSGRVAVICEDRQLTYGELDRAANRLAQHLVTLGAGPEKRVGLCLERSEEMVTAILAVLKTGAAYLPLDPTLPGSRLLALISEAQVGVLVTRRDLDFNLAASQARVVALDRDREVIDALPSARLAVEVHPESAAYVLFTSGSSGTPKGVVVEHRQLTNYVSGVIDYLPPTATYAMAATFAADLGNTAIFGALASGAAVDVIPAALATDPEGLAAHFAASPADCLKIVPSHLAELLAGDRPERLLPRGSLVLGGEACRWDLVDRVHQLAPTCLVLNEYGPTEATVGAMITEAKTETSGTGMEARRASVSLGVPQPNACIYLTDRDLRPAAIGGAGEILIGGDGLTRGYLEAPAKTAERFIPDPFAAVPSGRLYRTGDLARFLPDGEMEFLGRMDHQVKVRGFRVELGEIEATLGAAPGVMEAVVVADGEGGIARRLIAYVVLTAKNDGAAAEALRGRLHERLPEYMMPALICALPSMPRTASGKIDRLALPDPDELGSRPQPFVAPRTTTEREIATHWGELLKVEKVGVIDNFFDLGGHSLLANRALSWVRRTFEMNLSLQDFFERPTVEALAAAVDGARSTGMDGMDGMDNLIDEIEGLSDEEADRLLKARGIEV